MRTVCILENRAKAIRLVPFIDKLDKRGNVCIAQMDFGGVPFEKLMKNIELIGTEILPAIKSIQLKKESS